MKPTWVKTVINSEKFKEKNKVKQKVEYLIVQPYKEECQSDWEIICQNRELPPEIQVELKEDKYKNYALPNEILKTISDERKNIQKKHIKTIHIDKRWGKFSGQLNDKACCILGYQKDRKSKLLDLALGNNSSLFSDSDWLVARRFFQVHSNCKIPLHSLLAVVMGDVLANARELSASKTELASIGLPLAAWLIDCEGHLYNTWGEETYEPIFTKQFLRRIAIGMWELSTSVFGFSLFTYHDLAAYVGESDAKKVHRAIRRIGIITQYSKTIYSKTAPAIWVGAHNWKWNVSHPRGNIDEQCSFVHVNCVYQAIENLGDPCDERV
jgi:hypothetical protein